MTNDTFNTLNKNDRNDHKLSQPDEFAELDELFCQARNSEVAWFQGQFKQPFDANNFTKLVLNSLQANPKRNKPRSLMFDLIGLIIGLIAAYYYFDFNQLTLNALALIPESLSFTIANMLSLFAGVVGLACLAWWTADKTVT